jgi:hypothetical protein
MTETETETLDPRIAVAAARTLGELLTALRADDDDRLVDWTDLPSFGGDDPANTHQVWSVDPTHLLVGTCADDLEIVSRRYWDNDGPVPREVIRGCGDHGTGSCPECARNEVR